jgi:hypothetical protein
MRDRISSAFDQLLTAAEIIDTQDYPPSQDDIEYLGKMARKVRDLLIKQGARKWRAVI